MKSKIALIIGLLCFLSLPMTASAQDDVINLTFATFWPASDFQVKKGHMKWIQEIEERTDGKVNIEMKAGEALLGGREIYNGVAHGVADIGSTCPAYTPGEFPLMEAFELPGYENANAAAASMTVHEGYKRMKKELGVNSFEDVKVLILWATGPGDIMTKEPVRNLDDLDGMAIRAVGATVDPLERLGANPTGMPMSEAYTALQQGTVDGILGPNDILKGFKLAEVVNYATKTPFLYNIVFMQVMNKRTWNSLPPDVQKVFEELNDEYALKYGKLRAKYTRKGLEYGKKEHGMEVIQLSKEKEREWEEIVQPVTNEWIEKMENKGLPGEETVEIVKEMDAKYSEKYSQY
jgi:TRAP-type C4-dicarboxylate transport system substrate-binding protein